MGSEGVDRPDASGRESDFSIQNGGVQGDPLAVVGDAAVCARPVVAEISNGDGGRLERTVGALGQRRRIGWPGGGASDDREDGRCEVIPAADVVREDSACGLFTYP